MMEYYSSKVMTISKAAVQRYNSREALCYVRACNVNINVINKSTQKFSIAHS